MPGIEVEHRPETEVRIDRQVLREHLYLVEQAAVGNIPVVPGNELAFHYPTDQASRAAILQGLLDGTQDPAQAAPLLKPDGLTYDASEIGSKSLSQVMGQVRDATAKATHYDYERFSQFVANMHGVGIDIQTTEAVYDRIVQSRIRKIFLDTYGPTGRQQMAEAIQTEARTVFQNFTNLPSGEKIFEALKQNWAASDLMMTPRSEVEKIVAQLDPAEREVFETLKDPYRQFVQAGTAESFDKLTTAVKSSLEVSGESSEEGEGESEDESGQEGEGEGKSQKGKGQGQGQGAGAGGQGGKEQKEKEDLEDVTKDMDMGKDIGPNPTPDNPATPPDYQERKKIEEKRPAGGIYYYITPSGISTIAMIGHYVGIRKSHFDSKTKTWREKSSLTPYNKTMIGSERQTLTSAGPISGRLANIGVPATYAFDASSLKYQGAKPQIFRDQKGCFFIKARGSCAFSIDFLKEPNPPTDQPTSEDTKHLYQGGLSDESENLMNSFSGTNLERAAAIGKYIHAHHFYPGEGNLDAAQKVKYKLSRTPPAAFFQTLDASKYLECEGTSTLFVAMLRNMGIPSRVVDGNNVDMVKNGKAQMDSNTPHMWVEVWSGTNWEWFDVTPPAEHKDDKKQDQDQKSEPGQQADDGGVDQGENGEQGEEGESQEGESGEGQAGEGQPGEGKLGKTGKSRPDMKFQDQGKPGEASDQQLRAGQREVQQAQNTLKKIQQAQQRLEQELQRSESFQDLEDLKQQAETADIFDDMRQEIQDKIAAQEEAKKEALKETLNQMSEDGFIDQQKMLQILEQLEKGQTQELDLAQHQVEIEGRLFNEYQDIKERVRPKVNQWFDWFVERLPKEQEVDLDEDSLSTSGRLNVRAAMRPTNLYLGRIMNPRVVRSSERPMFLAAIEVDLSRSVMQMSPEKKKATEELMVFYCELFDRIEQTYGYMRWALDAFNDSVIPIKNYDQSYSSSQRNLYPDGSNETVKVRLMKALRIQGGTNINDALRYSAAALNEQVANSPDHMSALYFIGDGEDSWTSPAVIKRFVDNINPEHGFGPHQRHAIFLGTEREKQQLAAIFGEEHTSVCSDFDTAIEMNMVKFDEDIKEYLGNKIQ